MSKASEKELANLHKEVTKTLTRMVKTQTVPRYDKEGNEVGEDEVDPSPATLAVATKFLKDNAITVDPENNAELSDFAKALRDKGRVISSKDREVAMREVANGLLN